MARATCVDDWPRFRLLAHDVHNEHHGAAFAVGLLRGQE